MKASILAVVGGASAALASVRGFNYASQGQTQDGFSSQFKLAAGLEGANDFTSARLYTMIQEGTTNTPISAIQAAIDTKTTLLLGLWASGAEDGFKNEIAALKSAITQYGSTFADLVVGISVGSEDLYRISETGIKNGEGVGQSPDTLVSYIGQVREAIKGTSLASKPVGHVDTWNVYVNNTNSKVIAACDWLGLDEYPYFQTTDENSIDNSKFLFFQAYDRVKAVSGGKPIWITEAGWPVSGPKSNLAEATTENAETFWQDVACELECRNIDFWWYTLADAGASPSFGVSDNGKPLYNLACGPCGSDNSSNGTHSGSHSSSAAVPTKSGSVGSPNGGSSATATATGSDGYPAPTGGAGGAGGSSGSSGASSTSSADGSQYTGAAVQLEASALALVLGAAVAFFAL